MNKADLVDRIAGACNISKASATTAIDTAVDSVTAALKKGDRVALIGFGTFSVSQRKARNGRNPQTGATIKIAARRVAKFTPGAELKKAVNKGKYLFLNQSQRQGVGPAVFHSAITRQQLTNVPRDSDKFRHRCDSTGGSNPARHGPNRVHIFSRFMASVGSSRYSLWAS